MNLLIFDMDGVLLKPQGYHRALKETVRLAGISSGVGEVSLTDEQIAQFEALGISSEWNSSALCMAMIILHQQTGKIDNNNRANPIRLDLNDLFKTLSGLPMRDPALNRGVMAIEILTEKYRLPASEATEIIEKSESFEHSTTINWFQELVLGSDVFSATYNKPAQLETESYLKLFDQRLISDASTDHLMEWVKNEDCGAAVMTNRPSHGLPGYEGAPDAEMGAALVGIEALPLVGYGEVGWLGQHLQRRPAELSKPAWPHALAAILTASGWPLAESLDYIIQSYEALQSENMVNLENSEITVFEDTPGGIVAVQAAGKLLNQLGLKVKVKKIGIAPDPIKKSALAAHGAEVFSDINLALASLDNFGTFSSN